MILNSCFFGYIGIVKVSAVKNDRLVKFLCDDFEVGIAELLPVGEYNKGVGALKRIVSIL